MKKWFLCVLTGLIILTTASCNLENTNHPKDETSASTNHITTPTDLPQTEAFEDETDAKELKTVSYTQLASYKNLLGYDYNTWVSSTRQLNEILDNLDQKCNEDVLRLESCDTAFFNDHIILVLYAGSSASEHDFRLEQIQTDGENLFVSYTYDAPLDGRRDSIYRCTAFLISIPCTQQVDSSLNIKITQTNRRTAEDSVPVTQVDAALAEHYKKWAPIAGYDRTVITTPEELTAFWNTMDAKYTSKRVERSEAYDDTFFAENILLACEINHSSSRTEYALESASLRNGFLTLEMSYSAPPNGEDDDVITDYVLIRVPKADVSEFSGFELLTYNRNAVYEQ